ncbi:MAG: hypothetical protein R2942_03850 [Ignavibacteria bacterium]
MLLSEWLLTDLVGLKFKDAYKKAIPARLVRYEKCKIYFMKTLIIIKTLSGRKQDLFDIEWIKKYSSKRKKEIIKI